MEETETQRQEMMKNSMMMTRETAVHSIRAANDEEDRRFILSFSSEDPYERYFGTEILSHDENAVNLERLNSIGVVLFNHMSSQVVGRIERAWIEDRRGMAEIVFDDDEAAEVIRRKVASGTLKATSVGYRVGVWEEVAKGETSSNGLFEGPVFVASRWTPLEISIVSVPADATVGVGRELELQYGEEKSMDREHQDAQDQVMSVEPGTEIRFQSEEAMKRAVEEAAAAERTRVAEIMELCRGFDIDATEYIRNGSEVEKVRKEVLESLKSEKAPLNVRVAVDEEDKFRSAMSDAILMRGGVAVENPTQGALELRHLRLRDVMNECARRDGLERPERMSLDDLLRQFFTPTAAFPAVLDQTINKAYQAGYAQYPATYDIWTTKGSLPDFKPTRAYRGGSAGELLLVPEGGELKHDSLEDFLLPERQLSTKGRQFTLTREMMYNDDMSIVSSLPARYAAAARRTISKEVYEILTANPNIYDGTPLFSAEHGNLVTPGTAPNMTSLETMITMLRLQVDEEGNPIASIPRYVIVPIGLGGIVRAILASQTINVMQNGIISSTANGLVNSNIEVIEEAYLNTLSTGSSIAWYLIADKTVVPTIQIDYLNGNEIPQIRRMEYPGQLGFIWDIWLDWAITVIDFRGAIKNLGAAPTP